MISFPKLAREDFLQRAEDFAFVSFYETLPTHGVMVGRSIFIVHILNLAFRLS
jgi:hypothetical protein